MTRAGRSRARRLGRRAGIVVFSLLVAVPTAVWSIQIMLAVWAPPVVATVATCREGLDGLLTAVERARRAAELEQGGERRATERFRSTLAPEWNARAALDQLCSGPEEAAMLKAIDGLRYAEEHAVRYEATALSEQRARGRALSARLREGEKASP
jgi:putative protein kinase ArgK-like GTPase of G3E family